MELVVEQGCDEGFGGLTAASLFQSGEGIRGRFGAGRGGRLWHFGSDFGRGGGLGLGLGLGGGFAHRFELLEGVLAVNDAQFDRVVAKIRRAVGGVLRGARIAVWGLTFKAGTDDLRDSPAVVIVERLLSRGARVRVYDPTVAAPRPGVPTGVEICADPYGAVDGAEVVVVLTEWDEFDGLDPLKVASLMTGTQVVDARNLLDRGAWQHAGFTHQGIGR